MTNPVQFSSTVTGRALLEWYMQIEDYCCFLGAYKLLLPTEWREENIRIRKVLAGDYSHIPKEDRKPRILDDVWPQFLAIVPGLSDILYEIPKLKEKEGKVRAEAAQQLELELRRWEEEIDHFVNLPHVQEILEPAEFPPLSIIRHAFCCPQPPFVPHYTAYPPAGVFRMVIRSLKCYIRALMLPSIREAMGPKMERSDEEASQFSLEACRTFAGLEDTLVDGDPDVLLPLFAPLILATTTCPADCRVWLWYKLAHFEKLAHLTFDPVKRNLATLWNMPQIVLESSPPPIHGECLTDIEPKLQQLELRDEGDGEVDHHITRARGLGNPLTG